MLFSISGVLATDFLVYTYIQALFGKTNTPPCITSVMSKLFLVNLSAYWEMKPFIKDVIGDWQTCHKDLLQMKENGQAVNQSNQQSVRCPKPSWKLKTCCWDLPWLSVDSVTTVGLLGHSPEDIQRMYWRSSCKLTLQTFLIVSQGSWGQHVLPVPASRRGASPIPIW